MIIMAWVLMIVFGFISLMNLKKYCFASLHMSEAVLMVLSIIVTAISAGVIFGKLFQ